MTLVNIYKYLLLLIISIITLSQCKKYREQDFNYSTINVLSPDTVGLILCVFFTLLIGLRPMDPANAWQWADSANYNYVYGIIEGTPFHLDLTLTDPLWNNFFNFCASERLGISFIFLIGDIIYFGCAYIACRKWFPHDTAVAYLAFLGALSTYSYSFNGVRAGIAASLFLVGIAYYENKWVSILFILSSLGVHHSMQLPIGVYILTFFYKNPKWYFYGWFFCVAMALLHISFFQSLFAGMTDSSGADYLKGKGDGADGTVGGFRLDFILYSAAPVWIGYNLVMKEGRQLSQHYLTLLNMYLCTNGIWMLCMYAEYTNRIAYLSWFMYPFVLIYPFLKEDISDSFILKGRNQNEMFSTVLKYHLYFTLFMELVFYNFLKRY